MEMDFILVTNNDNVVQKYQQSVASVCVQQSYFDVLIKTRDLIHSGHKLLTHPLSSSIKPNETPYKSIVLSSGKNKLDSDSLLIIENSIATFKKFEQNVKSYTSQYTQAILEDFKTIDLTIISSALDN